MTQIILGKVRSFASPRRGCHPQVSIIALVAVARSILVIVWHLLADPTTRFHDLGVDYHTNRIDTDKKIRNHLRQLQALGYTVTLNPIAA